METVALVLAGISLTATVLLLLLVLGLARELGVVLQRMGPTTARAVALGPRLDEAIPIDSLQTDEGSPIPLTTTKAPRAMLFFVAPSCSVCEELAPAVRAFAGQYKGIVEALVISRAPDEQKDRLWTEQLEGTGGRYINAATPAQRMQITSTPFALLVEGKSGRVVTKGVINSLEQIESLIEVRTFGKPHHHEEEEAPLVELEHLKNRVGHSADVDGVQV